MLEKGRISSLQLAMIMYPAVLATVLLSIPTLLYEHAGRELWLSPIIASSAGYFLVWVSWRLHKRFPDDTLITMSDKIFGRIAGKLVSLVYLSILLFNISIIVREYGELILGRFLMRTPQYLILGSIVLIAAFAVRGGLEVIGRLSQLFVPLIVLLLILLFCLLIRDFNPENLFPAFVEGITPSLKGAAVAQGWFCDFSLLLFMLPYVRNKDRPKALKWGFISVTAVMATMVMVNLMVLLLFGNITGDLSDPLMTASTYISIGQFFQRMEPLVMGIWVIGCCIKIATFLYVFCLGFAQWVKLSDYRPTVLPLSCLTVFLARWVTPNRVQLKEFLDTIFPYMLTGYEGVLPLLLLIAAILFRRQSMIKE